jgi:hypothetical protein
MKTIGVILLLHALIGVAYAQSSLFMQTPALSSFNTPTLLNSHTYPIRMIGYGDIPAPVLKPYLNTYRYTAFFCKMELKAVHYFGIYIKVHAGDYDTYTKEAYRTR